MMKLIQVIVLMMVLLCIINACSLDRTNPLDPENNQNVNVPQQVTGLTLTSYGGVVYAKWNRFDNVSKYKLYRSLSHDGQFELIATIDNPSAGISEFVEYIDSNVQLRNYYYYKISAVSLQGLEGPISPYKWVKVV